MGFVLPLERVPVRKSPASSTGRRQVLQDVNEYAYLLTVQIGDQPLPVILDTGSSDLWVASTECALATAAGVATYNASLSRSFVNATIPFALNYLAGSAHGTVAWETVLFGSYVVARQAFALVDRAEALDLTQARNSGILGLAFANRAAIDARAGTTLLENVFSHLKDDEQFFGVRLAREGNSSFSVGKLDPNVAARASEIAYSAVFPTASGNAYDYWKLPLHHLTVDIGSGPMQFDLSPSKMPNAASGTNIAVFDTGTTLILGPSTDIVRFYALLGDTARQGDGGLWEVKCTRRVSVSFAFGNVEGGSVKEYALHPFDVSWDSQRYLDWCLGGLQVNDGVISADWLLGDTFLRNVYLTHKLAQGSKPPILGLLNLTDPVASAQEFEQQRGADAPNVASGTALITKLALHPQQPAQSSHTVMLFMLALGLGVFLGASVVLLYAWRSSRHEYGRLPPAAALRRRQGSGPISKKKVSLAD